MKMSVILIVVGVLGTVSKGLVKGLEDLEIRGQVETIQKTVLFRSARILSRIPETWEHLLSLNHKWESISKCWWGKTLIIIIKIIITAIITLHNPTPVLENNTHKLLWVFDIHTDHQISARGKDLIKIKQKKRTYKIFDFAVPADHRIKLKECEKTDKYLDHARELKRKLWNNYTSCNWCCW